MLDFKKIKIMTKLAAFEQGKGKEDIKISKYYKTDYIRYQVIKTAVSVTLGYLLILLLFGMYHAEYIIRKIVTLNFVRIGQYLLGFYIIIMAIYITGAFIGYSVKYNHSKKNLSRYYKLLKKLNKFYQEDSADEKGEA
ncbi:hypothetical protein [Anaerocolumna xylanovorans]|uniref:Uncharacterized protein n=1 Tax=Anaerocolumna xylanovorans DSM 12503 TaxID=1121345 RepID=A0A1M7YHT8_9FIRM|nr:hypothetical protein [Anaerocolumna xylanovorans]SHO52163.1 hypothetical protein SAMN02745217_03548 [Anaerocolumna xylanovorans DSM 12503]